MNTGYLPYGFVYPKGFAYCESKPDPALVAIRERIDYLNKAHERSGMPGHIFFAALALLQKESGLDVDVFWNKAITALTGAELAEVAKAMEPAVADEPPRLDFPNTVALFDCRFISNEEWRHIRRYSIGGSEASAVLGLSHFKSPAAVYYSKKQPRDEERDLGGQHILDYGHAVEPYIINEIATRLGARPYPEYRMFAHKDYPFITCNPDSLFMFPDGSLTLYEAKTAFWRKLEDWKDGIPEYYFPQPIQYMEVFNDPRLSSGYIGVCFGALAKDVRCHGYQRNLAAGAAQVQTIVDFWRNHIEVGIVPDFTGDPDFDFADVYDNGPKRTVTGKNVTALGAAAVQDFEEYFSLGKDKDIVTQQIKLAKDKESRLMEIIRNSVPEGLTLVCCPGKLTYRIKANNSTRQVVSDFATIPAADQDRIYQMAEHLRDKPKRWGVPKIKKQVIKTK